MRACLASRAGCAGRVEWKWDWRGKRSGVEKTAAGHREGRRRWGECGGLQRGLRRGELQAEEAKAVSAVLGIEGMR